MGDMKYIRSKYGKCLISMKGYEYLGEDDTSYVFKKIYKRKHADTITRFPKKICTIADTIEELCDEFVLKATIDGKSEYQIDERTQLLRISKMCYEKDFRCLTDLFGAIWCDKGLIYVAKVNESGVMELI